MELRYNSLTQKNENNFRKHLISKNYFHKDINVDEIMKTIGNNTQ